MGLIFEFIFIISEFQLYWKFLSFISISVCVVIFCRKFENDKQSLQVDKSKLLNNIAIRRLLRKIKFLRNNYYIFKQSILWIIEPLNLYYFEIIKTDRNFTTTFEMKTRLFTCKSSRNCCSYDPKHGLVED